MITITISSQKGGTGKSATAHALGAGLARHGNRVLLVDLDAQRNLTYCTGAAADGGAWDTLTGIRTAAEATQSIGGIDILAASPGMYAADLALQGDAKGWNKLRDALRGGAWDYCIIDTPPALGNISMNALTAADYVVIPVQTDSFSYWGAVDLGKTINAIRERSNPGLKLAGILICRYRTQTKSAPAWKPKFEKVAAALGGSVFNTVVRECVAIQDAATAKKPIYEYSPRSNGAADYAAVTAELIERTGTK